MAESKLAAGIAGGGGTWLWWKGGAYGGSFPHGRYLISWLWGVGACGIFPAWAVLDKLAVGGVVASGGACSCGPHSGSGRSAIRGTPGSTQPQRMSRRTSLRWGAAWGAVWAACLWVASLGVVWAACLVWGSAGALAVDAWLVAAWAAGGGPWLRCGGVVVAPCGWA